ncbi:MAG: hypothetical protein OXH45_01905 [Gammaproteobacteria bacterium]|nr:hypothetical protein [Gammaproteobacteria bacterium]
MSDSKIFVDGLMSAVLRDGVVRLEFGEFEADQPGDDNKPPNMIPKTRVAMPWPGFLRTLRMMQEVNERLRQEVEKQRAAQANGGTAT